VENGDWGNASAALVRLKTDAPKTRPLDVRLLDARVLAGRGENDAALAAYRDLVPVFVGLEARYRYGEFLARLERHEAASHMFDEVIKHSRRFASSIEDEQRWAAAARQAISNR
jgi:hypothetical protein